MQLKYIKGLSDNRIEDLAKLNIDCAERLIRHFPRNYLDLTRISPLKFAYPNEYLLTQARIVSMPQSFVSTRKIRCIKIACEQNNELFTVIWFNQPYVLSKLKQGVEYLFYGRIQNKFGQISMVNPTFEPIEKNDYLKGIIPVYTVCGNLYQKSLQKSIIDAVHKVNPTSVIPNVLIKKYGLCDLKSSYLEVHSPTSIENKDKASERIAIEEYYMLISAFKYIKGGKEQVRLNKYNCLPSELKEFTQRFGFEFTNGQKLAVNEIYGDMTKPIVMNRLMQGDVGCGKTAVALSAIYIALKSGFQSAFLAPTEVLAKQNFNLAKTYLPEFNIVFLSGSLTIKQKNEIKKEIKSGYVDLVVGTHAVIQDDVQFDNLSLCVCDEQHRFGVSQRSNLLSKGVAPDLLVMSATPIPRTLSLIFYGDLDITTIKDKPKARAEIQTNIVPMTKYNDMLTFIQNEIKQNHSIYFVAPKIEEDPEGEIMSVTELYQDLVERLPLANIRLLHGKMKDKEKESIMLDFKNGVCNALVSTTVIEVGIDVKNATVMVIYNSERFGLSQLHQLRGRVGRSDIKSYCFLLTESQSPDSIERLKTLCKSDDGFKISEADFTMRGSGDFLGTKQSGRSSSELGALRYTTSAIFTAKSLSDEVFNGNMNDENLKKFALEKYNKLCEVSLN